MQITVVVVVCHTIGAFVPELALYQVRSVAK